MKKTRSENLTQQIVDAGRFLTPYMIDKPKVGIIIGSGLGRLKEYFNINYQAPYSDIPHFPESTVAFHAAQWIFGALNNIPVIVMNGRYHFYEGLTMQQVTLPVRVMHNLGINSLIITHAAGSIQPDIKPGTLAVTIDHINMMGDNPQIGEYDPLMGERFTDMSCAYTPELVEQALIHAGKNNINLKKTTFCGISGPSLPSCAEIAAFQKFGIDTLGMSVVPEVLVARQLNMRLLTLTAVTDQSLPYADHPKVDKKQVAQHAQNLVPVIALLIENIIKTL